MDYCIFDYFWYFCWYIIFIKRYLTYFLYISIQHDVECNLLLKKMSLY